MVAHVSGVVCLDPGCDPVPSRAAAVRSTGGRRAAAAPAPTPLGQRFPTLGDPASGSIAGRRASGFLQVSLSKVPRPQHRAHISTLCAETLPINASDYSGVILGSLLFSQLQFLGTLGYAPIDDTCYLAKPTRLLPELPKV